MRRLMVHHPSAQRNAKVVGLLFLVITLPSLTETVIAEMPFPTHDWTYSYGTSWTQQDALGDALTAFSVDINGNLLLAGGFGYGDETLPVALSADFDPTLATDRRTTAGLHDVDVVSLSPSGEYLRTLTFGGTGDDLAWGLVAFADGSVIVAGYFEAAVDFDPGPGVLSVTSAGGRDVFLSKFDSTGGHLWTRTFGAAGNDHSFGLIRHPDGGVVVFGEYAGTVDFDPGPGVTERTAAGGSDVFFARFTDDGDLVSVTAFGGASSEHAHGLAVDERGAVFVAGEFAGTPDFDPGPGEALRTRVGSTDAFLARYNADGTFAWVWTIGSPRQDVATDVKLSPLGEPIVVGLFGTSTDPIDFDPTDGTDPHRTTRTQEVFVTKLGPDLSYRWTRTTATNSYVYANTLAVGANGIVVTGAGSGNTDFSPSEPTPHVLTLHGPEAYAWRLSPDGDFEWVFSFPRTSATGGSNPIAADFDPFGNLLLAGSFFGTCDFDPGATVATTASLGGDDAFFVKLRGFHPCADHDGDELVDLRDLAALFECFGGSSPGTNCTHFDFNENLRIDAEDFAEFHDRLTGP